MPASKAKLLHLAPGWDGIMPSAPAVAQKASTEKSLSATTGAGGGASLKKPKRQGEAKLTQRGLSLLRRFSHT